MRTARIQRASEYGLPCQCDRRSIRNWRDEARRGNLARQVKASQGYAESIDRGKLPHIVLLDKRRSVMKQTKTASETRVAWTSQFELQVSSVPPLHTVSHNRFVTGSIRPPAVGCRAGDHFMLCHNRVATAFRTEWPLSIFAVLYSIVKGRVIES